MESTSHSSEALPQSQIGASRSSSLPPSDSPLTKVFLGQYVSSLIQETITYLKLSYSDLALLMFIPEMVLRDAVEGKMGLTRGQWVRLGQELELPTTYQLRPAERDGTLLGNLLPARFPHGEQDVADSHPSLLTVPFSCSVNALMTSQS